MMATGAMMLVAKATLLLVLATTATLVLPKAAAGLRHAVWALAMLMLLLLPAVTLLPGVRVPVPAMALPVGMLPMDMVLDGGPGVDGGDRGVPARPASPTAATGAQTGVQRPVAQRAGWQVADVLFAAWAAGVLVILLWLALGRVALHRILRRATPLEGERWNEAIRDAAWLLEAGGDVRLFVSAAVRTPVTWGLARPVIVLPVAAGNWADDRRRAVLLHELAHVARRDCLTQTVASIACAVWWFHPMAWYAARRMRVERERACDDMVLAAGTAPTEYASHLLEVARGSRGREPAPMLSLQMARPSQLEGRLLAILAGSTGGGMPSRRGIAVAATAAITVTGAIGTLHPVSGSATGHVTESVAAADVRPAGPRNDNTVAASDNAAGDDTDTASYDAGRASGAPDTASDDGVGTAPRAVAGTADPATDWVPVVPDVAAVDTPPASSGSVRLNGQDSVARIVPRLPLRSARFAITSTDGRTALLLRDTTILLQLTDHGLETIARGDDAAADDRGFLSTLFGGMLRGGLRVLLDRGIEYSLRDLSEARYRDGRLVLQNVRGNDAFENVNIDGQPLMESFAERDAREFARRVNAARARLR